MKQIQSYHAEKYDSGAYECIEEGVYFLASEGIYVTSLSFVPEEELGEYDEFGELAQYPLEDVLEKFSCYISDFCTEEIPDDPSAECREFASEDLEDIRQLRTIIGKHVYNREDGECVELVIEEGQVEGEFQAEQHSAPQAQPEAESQPEPQTEPNVEPQPQERSQNQATPESKPHGLLGFLKSLFKRK